MKKILILFPILTLLIAGCSLTQKAVIDNSVSNKTAPSNEDVSSSSMAVNIKESQLQSSTTRRDSVSRNFKCSDESVKVADLMVGDTFDSYGITKISDAKNSSGSLSKHEGYIAFEGEKTLTGRFIIREKNLGWEPIYFQPDSQSLLPSTYLKYYKIESNRGIEYTSEIQLKCSNNLFILETDTSGSDKIGDKFDFPVISKMIPDFPDFWAKAGIEKGKDTEYSKKVVIRVNNINSSWVLNGGYDTHAHLIEIIKVID